jgi:hypothetical protein
VSTISNVKIVSKGNVFGTEVLVDGVKMTGVQRIEIAPLDARTHEDPLVRATITVVMSELEMDVDAEYVRK